MKYKAIALDLDGTLTDHNKKLPAKNIEAVDKAIDIGVKVILASGRPLFGITPIADELKLPDKGGYILAYNGGKIVDCVTGETIVSHQLPKECIDDICDFAKTNDVYALTYSDGKIVSESDTDEYVLKEAFCNAAAIIKTDNLKVYVNYPVSKFLVVGKHEKLIPVQEALLSKYHGVTEAELIACGDGMNDIPMLKIAGLSAVMENAYPEVKKYADYIAPSNDDAGVADIIKRYILDMENAANG